MSILQNSRKLISYYLICSDRNQMNGCLAGQEQHRRVGRKNDQRMCGNFWDDVSYFDCSECFTGIYQNLTSHVLLKNSQFIVCQLHSIKLFQFSSVSQSYLTLCDPMDYSMPGLPFHHQLPEFTQTHVHCVCDAIQPSHPLSSPSPPTFTLSQHQGLFQMSQFFASGGQSIGVSASKSVLLMDIQD